MSPRGTATVAFIRRDLVLAAVHHRSGWGRPHWVGNGPEVAVANLPDEATLFTFACGGMCARVHRPGGWSRKVRVAGHPGDYGNRLSVAVDDRGRAFATDGTRGLWSWRPGSPWRLERRYLSDAYAEVQAAGAGRVVVVWSDYQQDLYDQGWVSVRHPGGAWSHTVAFGRRYIDAGIDAKGRVTAVISNSFNVDGVTVRTKRPGQAWSRPRTLGIGQGGQSIVSPDDGRTAIWVSDGRILASSSP